MPPATIILLGVALDKVAVPLLILKAKSDASNAPLPPLVLYTASLNVTAMLVLSDARETDEIVGTVVSIISALFAPSELLPPGDANVLIAALPAASFIVPLLSAKASTFL